MSRKKRKRRPPASPRAPQPLPISSRLLSYYLAHRSTRLTIYDLHEILYGRPITDNPKLRQARLDTTRSAVVRAIRNFNLHIWYDRSARFWMIGP